MRPEDSPADRELADMLAQWIARECPAMRGLDDPADPLQRQQAAVLAGQLHRSLSSLPSYQRLERSARGSAPAGSPWRWRPLLDDSRSRAGLMYLEGGKYVPLHNHPGAMAITLVVSGKVEVVQCDMDENCDDPQDNGQIERDLTVRWCGSLEAGEATFLTGAAGNIHSFTALADTLIFDLFAVSYSFEKRSWFIPEAKLFSRDGTSVARWLAPPVSLSQPVE